MKPGIVSYKPTGVKIKPQVFKKSLRNDFLVPNKGFIKPIGEIMGTVSNK
jgi:hypothetical protein